MPIGPWYLLIFTKPNRTTNGIYEQQKRQDTGTRPIGRGNLPSQPGARRGVLSCTCTRVTLARSTGIERQGREEVLLRNQVRLDSC